MTGNVFLHSAAGENSERNGSSVSIRGIVEIRASIPPDTGAHGGWHRIRTFDSDGEVIEGWISMRWVEGLQDEPPDAMTTGVA